MTSRILFATALCAALLAGCNKPAADDAAPATDATPSADAMTEPANDDQATDVLRAIDNSPAPEGLDVRAFAGSFSGTIPCADCPGIDLTITFKGDGSYTSQNVYQERDTSFDSSGTWTVEEAGKRIRLDPNSKDEQDRLLEVVSNDEVRMLDADGKAIESGLNYTLTRTAAPAH